MGSRDRRTILWGSTMKAIQRLLASTSLEDVLNFIPGVDIDTLSGSGSTRTVDVDTSSSSNRFKAKYIGHLQNLGVTVESIHAVSSSKIRLTFKTKLK